MGGTRNQIPLQTIPAEIAGAKKKRSIIIMLETTISLGKGRKRGRIRFVRIPVSGQRGTLQRGQ